MERNMGGYDGCVDFYGITIIWKFLIVKRVVQSKGPEVEIP